MEPTERVLIFEREVKIGRRPVEFKVIVGRRGGFIISRVVLGPRGGIFLQEKITLSADEIRRIAKAIEDYEKSSPLSENLS